MAVIYVLKCCDTCVKETYIGSTINFKTRMQQHNTSCNNENSHNYNQPLYQFIRENGGFGAWDMTIIDSLTTTNKNEILKCERKYIEEQSNGLNKHLPSRTNKEYYQDNREKLIHQVNLYRETNREAIKNKQKLYREANREKINKYHKQHYQDHKEEIAEKKKQYREANRETILKKMNEKIQCKKCGAFVGRTHLTRHQKTKKCINNTTK